MQSLIVGLLLAAVSAVSVIAFRHPNGYARLFPYLLVASTGVFACITAWHIAVEMTWDRIVPHLTEAIHPVAKQSKKELSLPYEWLAVGYLAVMAFLWINHKLPPFLQQTDGHGAKTKSSKTD